eukprot:851000-Pelagomonas_calceolata.AAC.1
MRNASSFRLRAHGLKCESAEVQDEVRALFYCNCFEAIKEMYQDDEYILMDGDKRARVRPTNGVTQ